MEIKIDIITQIRETIDWIKGHYDELIEKKQKDNLVKIINDIADLVAHKRYYLFQLQNATAGDFDKEVSKALTIAERDTRQLLSTITAARLTAGNLGLRLKLKLDSLANLKLTEIQRLNIYLNGNDSIDSKKVIESLSGFESQWIEIGDEIETLKHKV